MARNLFSALIVALTVLSTSLFAGSMSPAEVPGAKTVGVEEAKQLYDEGALFIDVRSAVSWKRGRIPKAVHLDLLKNFNEANLSSCAPAKEMKMVIYCNGRRCLRSSIAVAKALQWGYMNVYYFRDGFPAWVNSDYPVITVGNIVNAETEIAPHV